MLSVLISSLLLLFSYVSNICPSGNYLYLTNILLLNVGQELTGGTEQDFKNHNDLPLARIKRIMKSDEDVRMISAEAPVLFAKACEIFVLELAVRSWNAANKNKRKVISKDDVETAIKNTDFFDFLETLP